MTPPRWFAKAATSATRSRRPFGPVRSYGLSLKSICAPSSVPTIAAKLPVARASTSSTRESPDRLASFHLRILGVASCHSVPLGHAELSRGVSRKELADYSRTCAPCPRRLVNPARSRLGHVLTGRTMSSRAWYAGSSFVRPGSAPRLHGAVARVGLRRTIVRPAHLQPSAPYECDRPPDGSCCVVAPKVSQPRDRHVYRNPMSNGRRLLTDRS